ncbi:hypothetical protein CPC08DRAFT_243299 [Agrocybe pediades]|nr:hypothetical protein CPC08DRAFT_243299 [Agrocybe pediades]
MGTGCLGRWQSRCRWSSWTVPVVWMSQMCRSLPSTQARRGRQIRFLSIGIRSILSDTHGYVAFVGFYTPHFQPSGLTGPANASDKQRYIATHFNSATTFLSSSSMARPVTQAATATLKRFYLWFKGRCHCMDCLSASATFPVFSKTMGRCPYLLLICRWKWAV